MRFQYERTDMLARIRAGEETIRHVAGRFFIKRLVKVGATGLDERRASSVQRP